MSSTTDTADELIASLAGAATTDLGVRVWPAGVGRADADVASRDAIRMGQGARPQDVVEAVFLEVWRDAAHIDPVQGPARIDETE